MIGSFHPSPTFHPASRFRLRITIVRHAMNATIEACPKQTLSRLKSNYPYSSTSNKPLGLKPQEHGSQTQKQPTLTRKAPCKNQGCLRESLCSLAQATYTCNMCIQKPPRAEPEAVSLNFQFVLKLTEQQLCQQQCCQQ